MEVEDGTELFAPGARSAIARARAKPVSYTVRVLRAPGARTRVVVVLGEAHLKLAKASRIGKDVVAHFELRGVETFPIRRVTLGRLLWLFVHGPRLLLRALSLGTVKGSTITDAKALPSGHTVELEGAGPIPLALHVGSVYLSTFFGLFFAFLFCRAFDVDAPWLTVLVLLVELHLVLLVPAWMLRRKPWAWIVHPFMAILGTRDVLMARGTVHMLAAHPEPRAAVVVMGRAHASGYVRTLVEEHGFTEVDMPPAESA